ncbi:MAG: hypothetical protein JXR50_03660 [Prolixibacteraceae bacterium]|nr:hypothetical protein [Prolixibacteraceae bacterium]MBN2648819.1 hypothetical protein [Prolixibacteraceae bacterium]
MSNKNRKYSHIKTYNDIQSEIMQLGYQSRISKKELEIRSMQLRHDLHPARLIPSLIAQWATPMMFEMKNQMFDLLLKLISNPKRGKSTS